MRKISLGHVADGARSRFHLQDLVSRVRLGLARGLQGLAVSDGCVGDMSWDLEALWDPRDF